MAQTQAQLIDYGTAVASSVPTNGPYLSAANTVAISTNGAQRVTVDSTGRVGIGTVSPGQALQIAGNIGVNTGIDPSVNGAGIAIYHTTFPRLTFRNSTTGDAIGDGAQLVQDGLDFNIANTETGAIKIFTANSERARIDSSGRLLVGTSTSLEANALIQAYKSSGILTIRGESGSLADGDYVRFASLVGSKTSANGIYKHSGIPSACPFIELHQENGQAQYYWTDNSGNFRISTNPNFIGTTSGTVVGTQTSDERIKNILGPVEYGLDTIKKIEPVRFSLKSEPDTEKLGFIAQQVQPLVPQSVFDTNEHIEGEPEDAPTKLGMEYVSLIPVLVNAIKELSAEVDALKSKAL